jgi:RHS repeat-associated protein
VGGGVPNAGGCVPSEYQPQKCPILVNGEPVVPYPFQDTKVRPETYYYHPDHLGSTSWVTDQNGKVHEHVEYFPYGEVWREPKIDRDGAGVKGQRFLFSGKELDEETGLYYFGARYYDPVRVRWASTDPILPAVLGDPKRYSGVPIKLSLYEYAGWTPIRLVDPDGRDERPKLGTQESPGGPVRVALGSCSDCHAGTPQANYLKAVAFQGHAAEIIAGLSVVALLEGGLPVVAEMRTALVAGRSARTAASLGDLTVGEVRQIQTVVNEAGRPLEVVGSAARGARRGVGTDLPLGKGPGTRSDIDFVAPPSSHQNFKGLEGGLPSLDPKTGIIPGTLNQKDLDLP